MIYTLFVILIVIVALLMIGIARDAEAAVYWGMRGEQVRRVQERLPEEDTIFRMSELFKMFGDGTRLKILCALLEGECCVCDLAKLLGMTISAVSHQLRLLRQAK